MKIIPPLRFKQAWHQQMPIQTLLFLVLLLGWACMATFMPLSTSANTAVNPASKSTNYGTPSGNMLQRVSAQPRSAAAAQAIPGQPQVDQYTVALYHFDAPAGNNQVIDATGRYTATLQGGTYIAPSGLYGGVLVLDGQNSFVNIGNLGPLSQGTIELYVDFSAACPLRPLDPGLIVAGSQYGGADIAMELTEGLLFDINVNGQINRAISGINPCRYMTGHATQYFSYAPFVPWPYDTWRFHHVAATWGPRGMEVWIDGVLNGIGRAEPPDNVYNYSCNPQMYAFIEPGPYSPVTPNPYYPERCIRPLPAPQWTPSYPPGDYTGPLPSYDTFLIGCKPTGICFQGRIDEVRISNIQRTFHYSVVPTVTPIPTQTPVPITGEYSMDANTAGLYHLNTSVSCHYPTCVLDEVTNLTKPAIGVIAPNGRFGSALASNGNSLLIEMGDLNHSSSGTVEAWFKLFTADGPQPFFSFARYPEDPSGALIVKANSPVSSIFLGIFDGAEHHSISAGVMPASLVGCWHHIAGSWGSRGLEIWIDGNLRAVDPTYTGGMVNTIYGSRVGSDFVGNTLSGMVDEVRVSWLQRTFTQAKLAMRNNARAPFADGTPLFLPFVQRGPTTNPCPFGN